MDKLDITGNLGPAVNGELDDEFFSITHCGNYGIFSKQVNVHNVDLYRVSLETLFNRTTRFDMKKQEKNNSVITSL